MIKDPLGPAWKLIKKAYTLKTVGRFDDAVKCYDLVLERFPELRYCYKVLQYKVNLLEYQLKRYDDVIETCNKAIELYPNNCSFFLEMKDEAMKKLKGTKKGKSNKDNKEPNSLNYE